jgi:hypothetical protein
MISRPDTPRGELTVELDDDVVKRMKVSLDQVCGVLQTIYRNSAIGSF